jgi:hypothetical protein
MKITVRLFCTASLSAVLLTTGSIGVHGNSGEHQDKLPKGMKSSDPHLAGQRDLNYDHTIVPGSRIGPVQMAGLVSDAVQHLGNPNSVVRSTFRGPGYYADEVYYFYKDECISFTWIDSGIEPKIEEGWRGINVTCDKWSTPNGLHVGSSMKDVNSLIGEYCATNQKNGSLLIATKRGIWFHAKDRNSPVSWIAVVPVTENWGGMCKD